MKPGYGSTETVPAAGAVASTAGPAQNWDRELSMKPCDPQHVEDMANVVAIVTGDTAVGPEKAGGSRPRAGAGDVEEAILG